VEGAEDSYILWGFHYLEWLAFVSSLLYTVLAAKKSIYCWFFGLLGAGFTLVLCLKASLFSESVLQVFYILMAIYGWWSWSQISRQDSPSKWKILRMTPRHHLMVILSGTALALVMGYFWSHFGAALPYIDAFTTGFSFLATWLIARRYLENWLYWIAIDALSIFVYHQRDLVLLSLLFAIYTLLAAYGYWAWRREWRVLTDE